MIRSHNANNRNFEKLRGFFFKAFLGCSYTKVAFACWIHRSFLYVFYDLILTRSIRWSTDQQNRQQYFKVYHGIALQVPFKLVNMSSSNHVLTASTALISRRQRQELPITPRNSLFPRLHLALSCDIECARFTTAVR